jgi:hypothetical protein
MPRWKCEKRTGSERRGPETHPGMMALRKYRKRQEIRGECSLLAAAV